MINFNDAVASLLKAGAKRIDNIVIKNVTVTPQENYVRLGLTLDKPIPGYVSEDDGSTYALGETTTAWISLYSVAAVLRENEDACGIVNHIVSNPNSVSVILNHATISIAQQEIGANDTYMNHFTGEEVVWSGDHDTIFNHIIAIDLGKKGLAAVDKIENSLLGI